MSPSACVSPWCSLPTTYLVEFPLPNIYRSQTKFAKVMFLQVSVCPGGGGVRGRRDGACMAGSVRGRGCTWQGGVRGRGHAWQAVCMAGGMHGSGVCVVGGVHGRGVCSRGHAWRGACVAGGAMCDRGLALRGACVAGSMHAMHCPSRYNEIRSMSGRYASYWNAFLL